MPKNFNFYKAIPTLRESYFALLTGKESLIQLIEETEVAEQVYNSNAIENSTLTLEETDKILQQIELDRYISEREIFEAKNLARVVEYINTRAKEKELDREMILLLHKMLISNIQDDIAGRFRQKDEWVRVGSYIAPGPDMVEGNIQALLTGYQATPDENIVRRIARLHLEFEHTHPFCDGNGRIGRVIINYLLIREGYVPINIKFLDRLKYYEAFREHDKNGTTEIMEQLVGRALTNSYHKRLAYLQGARIVTLAEYAKLNNTSLPNVINKAHRQTISAFIEHGVWKIGV